jgi:acetylornithine/succinyldiaminopimelate/putrescine aminotransferase
MKLRQRDKSFLARDSKPQDLQITRSKRSHIFDAKGRKYIDFSSGWCVGNLGWSNRKVEEAIRKFKGPVYVDPSYLYKPWTELAELLAQITPGKLKKCFRATGGTEAIELALQASMLHTRRFRFISLEGSYHGNSVGAFSIGSSEYREKLKNLLPHCYKVEPPLDEKALTQIEARMKRRDIAAFVMEPISINLGVLIPAKEFMARLQQLCRRYGTLLVMDEVACGFGRTGKIFASEHFEIEPDILCLAKAITGGYGAMGATITTEPVATSMEANGTFYSTYGWHPLSVQAAIANIRSMIKHKKSLLKNVAALSAWFDARLSELDFSRPVRIRVKGLAIALEFQSARYASKLQDKCRKNGLILTSAGESTVLLLPALNMDRKTARKGLDILEASL